MGRIVFSTAGATGYRYDTPTEAQDALRAFQALEVRTGASGCLVTVWRQPWRYDADAPNPAA